MPRGRRNLSEDQVFGIIQSVFSGKNDRGTAESFGVSVQTVRNRRSRFVQEAEKEGLFVVARSYNVEGTVRRLVDLSQELGNDLTVSESVVGARVVKKLHSMNVDESKLDAFIDGVYKESQTQSMPPKDLVGACVDLRRIKQETGKGYLDTLIDYEHIVESNEKLSVENARLAEENRSIVCTIQDSLREKETIRETLTWFIATKEKLMEADIPVEELERLSALVLNMKTRGYDLEPIVEFYSSSTDLAERKVELDKRATELQVEQSSLSKKNDDLKQEIAGNQQLVNAANELESMKLDRDRVRVLIEAVTLISARHGIGHTDALEEFFLHIENQYDEKLGYENELSRLKSRISRLEQDIIEKGSDLARLERTISPKKDVVESLLYLNEQNVRNEDIIHWSQIVSENNMDLITVRREISQLGGLRQWFDEKNQEKRKLEGEIESLSREIETLKSQKENYEAELKSLTTGALAEAKLELKRLPGIIDDLRTDLLDPETGLKAKTLTMIDNTHDKIEKQLNKKEESWTKLFKAAEEKVEELDTKVNDILKATYEAGKIVGQYKALEPIHKLEAGENVPRYIGLNAIYRMTIHFRNWFKKQALMECLRTNNRLIDLLDRELRNPG